MALYLLSDSLVNVFSSSNETILLLDGYMAAIMKMTVNTFSLILMSVTKVEYLLSQRLEQLC